MIRRCIACGNSGQSFSGLGFAVEKTEKLAVISVMFEFEYQPLTEDERRGKVAEARRMSPEEKSAEVLRLTELAFRKQRERVAREHPEADENEITRLCKLEMDEFRRREDEGIYIDVPQPR